MGFVGFEINSIVRTDPQNVAAPTSSPRAIITPIFFVLLGILAVAFLIYGPPVSILAGRSASPATTLPLVQEEVVVAPQEFTNEPQSDIAVEASEPAQAALTAYRVKPGDTLGKIWKQFGAPQYGGTRAAEALKSVGVSLKSLKVGDEIQILAGQGDIQELHQSLSNGDKLILRGNSKEGYRAEIVQPQAEESRRTAHGTITSTFVASARSAGVPYAVIDEMVDLFSARFDFRRQLQPGDTFSVTYMQRLCKETGDELNPGSVISGSVYSSGKLIAAVRHMGNDGKSRFYDEAGGLVGGYFLRYPLQFSRISSVFTNARFHPLLQKLRVHNGVDFAAPIGTPVRAVADGVVTLAGFRGGSGNMVSLQHGDRYSTAYLHLSKIMARTGTAVKRGQIIGLVGMSGLATGPHLHFSLYDRGRYVDPLNTPLPTITPGGERIPHAVLAAELENIKLAHQSQALASLVQKLVG